jgi:hypothetical protein
MAGYKAVYVVISAPRLMNEFMKCCDVFERGKVLGVQDQVTVSYTRRIDRTMKHAGKAIDHLRQAYESQGRIVSLVMLSHIASDDTVVWNKGKALPYVNPEVRIISTGTKWYMLDSYLLNNGYAVKTDQERFIIGVETSKGYDQL